MKLNTEEVELATTHGVVEQTDFSINVSAQAFSILSSGMYKNPIKAIIRELSTNAVDSHIDAGTSDKPYDIQLPTRFTPLFRIRDYGTGLSKKDVLGLYSTYFSSTKTDSNEQIGALGLGSKSPLGYTTSFSVVSYFNGEKTNFSVFIGDNGFPNIAVTGNAKSKEPSGLEIIIPVKEEGYYMDRWYENAREVYKFFDKFPNIDNDEDVVKKLALRKPTYEKTIGKIKIHSNSGSVANIVQGSIAYPLDYDQLEVDQHLLAIINNISFDIYMDIGEISFLPNREELSYDDKTKANIKGAMEVFVADLETDVVATISAIRKYKDACKVFETVTRDYQDLLEYKPEIRDMMTAKVARWEHWNEFLTIPTNRRYYYHVPIRYKIGYIADVLDKKFGKVVYFNAGRRPKYRDDYKVSNERSDIIFWVNDLKKAIITKFPMVVKDNNQNFLLPEITDVKKAVSYLKRKFGITNEQIKFTSSLTLPDLSKPKESGIKISRYRLVSYTGGYNPTRDWRWERSITVKSAEDNMAYDNDYDEIVWVETKSSQAKGYYNENLAFSDFLGGSNRSTWGLKYVHGVKSRDVEDVKKRANWIHINDYITLHCQQEINNAFTSDTTYHLDDLNEIVNFAKSPNLPSGINNVEINAIVDLLKDVNKSYGYRQETIDTKINNWNRKLGIENISEIGVDFDDKTVYNDGIDLVNFIKTNYPHLYLISSTLSYGNGEEVKNLINDLY